MITYQVEDCTSVLRDAEAIFPFQWEELSTEKEKIPHISPNVAAYQNLEAQGMLHCVTIRDNSLMVGYYIAVVVGHLHYRDAGIMAHTDLYYILPKYRVGGVGAKMLIFLEETLKARGVVKIYASTKVHLSNQKLFEALGYKATDLVLTKYIGN